MIDRFVARVGRLGAILIVVLAVGLIGFGGAAVEHLRLASQSEQQGDQSGTQEGAQQGQQGNQEAGQTNEGQSQENDNASGARQQGQQSD